MKRLLRFVFLGLVYSAPGEVLNQIFSHHTVAGFFATMRTYTILLVFACLFYSLLGKVFRSLFWRNLFYYLTFCTLGLSVEWLLLGNAPTLNPIQPFVQVGMMTYWGTFLFMPVMILEKSSPLLVIKITRFFVLSSLLYLVLGGLGGRAGVYFGLLVFVFSSDYLNVYYYRYFRDLYRRSPALEMGENASVPTPGV